jgi:flagellar basal-body rod modification protein FlgD
MLGHGVLMTGSDINLSKGEGLMGVDLTAPVDNLKVTIRNASGIVVKTMDLGSKEIGTLPIEWDGKTDKGGKAPDGKYTFDVEAKRGGIKVGDAVPLGFGKVMSVSTGAQGVKINVQGAGAVNLKDIRQIL